MEDVKNSKAFDMFIALGYTYRTGLHNKEQDVVSLRQKDTNGLIVMARKKDETKSIFTIKVIPREWNVNDTLSKEEQEAVNELMKEMGWRKE